ncbi:MAG: metal ABC transporter ATP-binding protein [Comamonadaceae bacterium]|nr:MAG: metal ABC transporter ATP-binding protein [Comamonadaceae bacterium]
MIRLENLTASYQRHPALHHVTGRFEKGSLTAVCGPNGAGKSTLLKSLLGLLPVEGDIELSCDRARIAYLPQQAEIDRSFPISVLDCVLLGFWPSQATFAGIGTGDLQRADAALRTVGLAGFARRPIGTLSSGQFQRVLFARLLVQDAELILLDEPFTAIDSRTSAVLMTLVKGWEQEGRTVIAVVHDHAQVRDFFPQCLLLAREVVAWGATASVMTGSNLTTARQMAEAWEEGAPVCDVDGQQNEAAKASLCPAFAQPRDIYTVHVPTTTPLLLQRPANVTILHRPRHAAATKAA